MVVRLCRVHAEPACGWYPHHFKHFPFAGMTRRHTTQNNPARYLPGFDHARIRELETATAREPDRQRSELPAKAAYLRDTREIIGWDLGQDATLSFVECSGGDIARSFHGRPMCGANPKAQGGWEP
jgi:hypothetical protein